MLIAQKRGTQLLAKIVPKKYHSASIMLLSNMQYSEKFIWIVHLQIVYRVFVTLKQHSNWHLAIWLFHLTLSA